MQSPHVIFGAIGIVLMIALWLRLTDLTIWKQDMWRIGVKIAVGLIVIGLVLALLYFLAPDFLSE